MNLIRLLPRFREAYRALGELEKRETWSRGNIEAFQLERLNAVWAHAIAHVPYYRRLAWEHALPPRFAGLEEYRAAVPLLQRDTVSVRPLAFQSEVAGPGRWTRTSGSTGASLSAFWTHVTHQEMLRNKYRFLAAWGIDVFDRTAFLWGRATSFVPGWRGLLPQFLQPVQDWLRNRIRLSAYHLGPDDLRRHLERLAAFRPVLLYGYSTAAYLLAAAAQARQFVPDALRLVVLTAEPVSPRLRDGVQRAFRVPAVVEYGSIECGFLAGEGPDRILRVREDGILLETLPDPDGRYQLVISVLNNPAFPLLRYVIGDVADAPLHLPAHGFASLRNIVGRLQDHLLTRSGRRIHAFFVDAVFESLPTALRWRVHQQSDGSLAVTLQMHDPRQKLDTARLRGQLEEIVEGYPVQVELKELLPLSAAGKHRWVFSDLNFDRALPEDKGPPRGCPPFPGLNPSASTAEVNL